MRGCFESALRPSEYAIAGVNDSFTNTEISKDHIEDIFDVHPPSEPSQRRGGTAQILGDQLLRPGPALAERVVERADGLLERLAMTRPGHQRAFGGRKK